MARLKFCGVVSIILSLLFISSCSANLVELDEDNWDLMLEGEWMVEL